MDQRNFVIGAGVFALLGAPCLAIKAQVVLNTNPPAAAATAAISGSASAVVIPGYNTTVPTDLSLAGVLPGVFTTASASGSLASATASGYFTEFVSVVVDPAFQLATPSYSSSNLYLVLNSFYGYSYDLSAPGDQVALNTNIFVDPVSSDQVDDPYANNSGGLLDYTYPYDASDAPPTPTGDPLALAFGATNGPVSDAGTGNLTDMFALSNLDPSNEEFAYQLFASAAAYGSSSDDPDGTMDIFAPAISAEYCTGQDAFGNPTQCSDVTSEIAVTEDGTFPPAYASASTTATPEPASLTLFGTGLMGLAGVTWRRRRRVAA